MSLSCQRQIYTWIYLVIEYVCTEISNVRSGRSQQLCGSCPSVFSLAVLLDEGISFVSLLSREQILNAEKQLIGLRHGLQHLVGKYDGRPSNSVCS